MYINKVIIYGNLTRDPEMKSLPSGMQVTSFGVATNRSFKDRDGKKQDKTEYHNCVAFGRQAETVAQYLRKGSGVYVEGRLETRSWDDKATGEKKYRTEIIADRIQFGPKGGSSGGGYEAKEGGSGSQSSHTPPQQSVPDITEDINPDDIPF
jgi:single-strand DNA-binding protein